MITHGLATKLVAGLVHEGLATAIVGEGIEADGKTTEAIRIMITDAGPRRLANQRGAGLLPPRLACCAGAARRGLMRPQPLPSAPHRGRAVRHYCDCPRLRGLATGVASDAADGAASGTT
jgi:hypothetical protein